MQKSRALLSVYNKEGLTELATALVNRGYELISSGGTAKHLIDAGLAVTPVESITGNPEAFEGRMKTLSFQIESAILFDRANPLHVQEAKKLGLVPIDVVVCNFYPFQKSIDKNLLLPQALELIDIGGPAMVRAAAKNFKSVLVVVDPADYKALIPLLQFKQQISAETRLHLAGKAFHVSAKYESDIDTYFQNQLGRNILRMSFEEGQKLRYGENPHQKGNVFWEEKSDPLALRHAKQISIRELSFNNLLDSDAATNVLSRLGGNRPACVIVKHANPCGAAFGNTAEEAFQRAWDSDPLAAFGGIVAMNRPITLALIRKYLEEKKFVELFLAPSIEEAALTELSGKKKNIIILTNPALSNPVPNRETDIKRIRGGILTQEADLFPIQKQNLEVVSKRPPTENEWRDLLFAWSITRESKSNTIILSRDEQMVGSGVGQQDRVRACKLALEKAREKARGASAASDGFFPFKDGPELLIMAGVSALMHPGGSIRDSETIEVCNMHNVALVTTKGIRAFKH